MISKNTIVPVQDEKDKSDDTSEYKDDEEENEEENEEELPSDKFQREQRIIKKKESKANKLKGFIKRVKSSISIDEKNICTAPTSFLKKFYKFMMPKGKNTEPSKQIKRKCFSEMSDADKGIVKSLILDLAFAFATFSVPSHRIESHLKNISRNYGVEAYYLFSGTGIFIRFGSAFDNPLNNVHFISVKNKRIDMKKLCDLDDIADDISAARCSCEDAKKRIKQVLYGKGVSVHVVNLATLFAFSVRSAMFLLSINGSWGEIIAGLIAGFVSGVLFILSLKYLFVKQMFPTLTAIVTMMIGALGKLAFGHLVRVSIVSVSLSCMLFLLPALDFTVGMAELSLNYAESGMSRLLQGVVISAQVGFGVLLANKIVDLFPFKEYPLDPVYQFDFWIYFFSVPIAGLCNMIGFKCPFYPFSILFSMISSYCAFFGTKYVGMFAGREIGTFVASFLVGIVGNIFSLIAGHPGMVVTTVGVIMLVPGSLTYEMIIAITAKDTTKSITSLVDIFMILVALVFGLLFSSTLVKTKKINWL